MSLKQWEKKVLGAPGAEGRVSEIEDELRLAAGLTALREGAGLSQRELAERLGVSQPRVAAIEQSRNVTIEVLEQFVDAVGGRLEVTVVRGRQRIPLVGSPSTKTTAAGSAPRRTRTTAKANSVAAKSAPRRRSA